MSDKVRKVALAAAVVILSCGATLAGPAQQARIVGHDTQFYSLLSPFGLSPAQYYPPPPGYEDPWSSPPPRSTRRGSPRNSYSYDRSSPSRTTVCTQIRNDNPERNFSCP